MALSPDQRRRLLRMNMLMSYAAFASAKATTAWTPATLFANAEVGGWYDPSDLTTMFQDAAGTTAAALESPVGLVLDKSKGLVLGSELVDTANTAAAWTAVSGSPTISQDGDAVKIVGTATGNTAQVQLSASGGTTTNLSASVFYLVTYQVRVSAGSSALCSFVNATISPVAINTTLTNYVTYTQYILPANTAISLRIGQIDAAEEVWIRNISVRELPGNHLSQSTSTARPVLSARKNLLVNTETLSTQNVTVRAAQHVLSFWGTGTITLSGVSTAGPLVGTGASNRVYIAFTPTAGTLTLTVSGTVSKAQLEERP